MVTYCCESTTYKNYNKVREFIEEAKLRAINRHKYVLSQERNEEISFEVAAEDWFVNCEQDWNEKRMKKMLELQRDEINRYKWIASEHACKDLGKKAVEEWIDQHAADWRVDFEKNYDEDDDY